jgi:hypothetical protein
MIKKAFSRFTYQGYGYSHAPKICDLSSCVIISQHDARDLLTQSAIKYADLCKSELCGWEVLIDLVPHLIFGEVSNWDTADFNSGYPGFPKQAYKAQNLFSGNLLPVELGEAVAKTRVRVDGKRLAQIVFGEDWGIEGADQDSSRRIADLEVLKPW